MSIELLTEKQKQKAAEHKRVIAIYNRVKADHGDAKNFAICRAVSRITIYEKMNNGKGYTEQSVYNITKIN